jgi:hypothetical protein
MKAIAALEVNQKHRDWKEGLEITIAHSTVETVSNQRFYHAALARSQAFCIDA